MALSMPILNDEIEAEPSSARIVHQKRNFSVLRRNTEGKLEVSKSLLDKSEIQSAVDQKQNVSIQSSKTNLNGSASSSVPLKNVFQRSDSVIPLAKVHRTDIKLHSIDEHSTNTAASTKENMPQKTKNNRWLKTIAKPTEDSLDNVKKDRMHHLQSDQKLTSSKTLKEKIVTKPKVTVNLHQNRAPKRKLDVVKTTREKNYRELKSTTSITMSKNESNEKRLKSDDFKITYSAPLKIKIYKVQQVSTVHKEENLSKKIIKAQHNPKYLNKLLECVKDSKEQYAATAREEHAVELIKIRKVAENIQRMLSEMKQKNGCTSGQIVDEMENYINRIQQQNEDARILYISNARSECGVKYRNEYRGTLSALEKLKLIFHEMQEEQRQIKKMMLWRVFQFVGKS